MSNFINSYYWAVIVFAQYFTISYMSFKASKNNSLLIYVYLLGILPTWTIICKYAKDIALAGYVFDFVIAAGWTLGVILFNGKNFGLYQYLGIAMMVIGILIFKR